MCLIITAFAAVIATAVWYFRLNEPKAHVGTLALMYWGASLMWSVDGVFRVVDGENFFALSLNDAALGAVIVLCALVAWIVMLLYSDPRNVVASLIYKNGR
jgi:hypothetical protein